MKLPSIGLMWELVISENTMSFLSKGQQKIRAEFSIKDKTMFFKNIQSDTNDSSLIIVIHAFVHFDIDLIVIEPQDSLGRSSLLQTYGWYVMERTKTEIKENYHLCRKNSPFRAG